MNHNKKQNVILTVASVLILAAISSVSLHTMNEPSEETVVEHPKSADVLSPALFTDEKTRAAYQAAKDIPDVLEQLPCFCGCMMNLDHKNNLFCFKDQHGSICDICQDIALDARKMHDQGLAIAQIQQTIRTKYAQNTP